MKDDVYELAISKGAVFSSRSLSLSNPFSFPYPFRRSFGMTGHTNFRCTPEVAVGLVESLFPFLVLACSAR